MKQIPYIEWDDENKVATCLLYYKNKVFYGTASCHPDDMDFANEKTGEHIAYLRAMLEALNWEKECEIKPALAGLKQAYYSMNHSKKFNPKSYEAKMLYHQIQIKQDDLEQIKLLIDKYKLEIHDFITKKDIFYKQLRALRARQAKGTTEIK